MSASGRAGIQDASSAALVYANADGTVDLRRTFTELTDSGEAEEDLSAFLRTARAKITWARLHDELVCVVVGEAGIGKTVELRLEADRLKQKGEAAFFVELNQLQQADDWRVSLSLVADEYAAWAGSERMGYFFLDAVDESRLTSHAAFKKALSIALNGLQPALHRVRLCLSSRITDWLHVEVQAAVMQTLLVPIRRARAAASAALDTQPAPPSVDAQSTSQAPPPASAFVVSLNPLTQEAARRLAARFKVANAAGFWQAVEEGGYRYMATRPLDLSWMVGVWNRVGALGTYAELLEGNVQNRLAEKNPSYQTAAVVLSPERLRLGAEELAAAAVFSGSAYVTLPATEAVRENEVRSSDVLASWSAAEIARLLGSAVFDEATFGRVKFHHRAVREYLAASWLHRQLQAGVPLPKIVELFADVPYGQMILIPSRRWSLCWLAAMHAGMREWVVQHFPEMLAFDGDPEAWDLLSVDRAFAGYVDRLGAGLRTDWYNEESEVRRVGRRLSPGRIANLLDDASTPDRVRRRVLPYVEFAHLTDCADVVFDLFASETARESDRIQALDALKAVATPAQREAVRSRLLAGTLAGNGLIAHALSLIGWDTMSDSELVGLFRMTGREDGYGMGPMARMIKDEFLGSASAAQLQELLQAVLEVMPVPDANAPFSKYGGSQEQSRAWTLEVLPAIFEELLDRLPRDLADYPGVCFAGALVLEELRDTGYFDGEDADHTAALIRERKPFRWALAQRIAQSTRIGHATARLTWRRNCIVSFDASDIPELVAHAADASEKEGARQLWFELALSVGIRELPGVRRSQMIKALLAGIDAQPRQDAVRAKYAEQLAAVRQNRIWRAQERARKRARASEEADFVSGLRLRLEGIAAGTDAQAIRELVDRAMNRSSHAAGMHLDRLFVQRKYGVALATALDAGLMAIWVAAEIPNPAESPSGNIPWLVLDLLSALDVLTSEPQALASFSVIEAAKAARAACWESDRPQSWFAALMTSHASVCVEALMPWIIRDAQAIDNRSPGRGALSLALNCTGEARRALLQPVVQLVIADQIPNQQRMQTLVKALRDDELVSALEATAVCATQLGRTPDAEEFSQQSHWLSLWLETDPRSAWAWYEERVAQADLLDSSVATLIESCGDFAWVKRTDPVAAVGVLVRIYALLSEQPAPAPQPGDADASGEMSAHRPSRESMMASVPGLLATLQTAAADRALVQLLAFESDLDRRRWIEDKRMDLALATAEQRAMRPASNLRELLAPFAAGADSERSLFLQAVALLDMIRLGIEEGPFSERVLFREGMPEKHLQLWLASRLAGVNPRAFSVHREEEVDNDKMPDIQLGTRHGNVCIEIKPLDARRSYSAASLTGTLRTQMVGQYLKGLNSQHGILLLLRLDQKEWTLPGQPGLHPFSHLVAYLQTQADLIRAEFPAVEALLVVGIDCTAPV